MGLFRDNIYVLETPFVERAREPTTHVTTQNVTITEHRAPTDDSVKLLREMEHAARQQVDLAVHVGNTMFECVVHRHLDAASDCVWLKAIFKLNGVQRTARVSYRPQNRTAATMEEVSKAMRDLRDEIAKVVATEMIHSALDSGCLNPGYLT